MKTIEEIEHFCYDNIPNPKNLYYSYNNGHSNIFKHYYNWIFRHYSENPIGLKKTVALDLKETIRSSEKKDRTEISDLKKLLEFIK